MYLNERQEALLFQVSVGLASTMIVNDARTLRFVPLLAPSSSIDVNTHSLLEQSPNSSI